MAVITKSAVKMRPRGETPFFCVIAVILCLGTMQSFLMLNQDYLSNSPEIYDSPLFHIKVEKKQKQEPEKKLKQEPEKLPTLSFPQSNEDHFHNPSVSLGKKVYMYHHTFRSPDGTEGSVILDMLLGHVYAFHQGGIYGGSCGGGNDVGREPENSLIRAIGLQDFLQFECPKDFETTDRKKVVAGKGYIQDGTRAFTPEYIDRLKSVIRYPKKQESQKKTNIIVVHIRRGEKFTPCRKKLHKNFEPYLPNKHYQVSVKTFFCKNMNDKCRCILSIERMNNNITSFQFFLTDDNATYFFLISSFISGETVTHQQIFERWLRKQSNRLFSVIILREVRRIPRKRLRAPY
jgi:hypothetical protein